MTFHFAIGVDANSRVENTEDGPVQIVFDTYHIEATDDVGRRWIWLDSVTNDEDFAEHQLRFLDHDPVSNPNAWGTTWPIYGSDAWDNEAEYEQACFEADAYGEPRPHW